MIQGPCKGCHYRHVGCHSDCLGYRKYRAEMDRIADARAAYNRTFAHKPYRKVMFENLYGQP